MLFRPNFCANCGEKIERVDWGLLTSRRFCPVCESEFKGHDLIPRVIVVAGVLAGVLGLGAYLKSGSTPMTPLALRQPVKAATQEPTQVPAANTVQAQKPPETTPPASNAANQMPSAATLAAVKPQVESSEPMYYCGAETKKGTPCSRRVKGNIRCYQHKGMPAMLPPDKLRIG